MKQSASLVLMPRPVVIEPKGIALQPDGTDVSILINLSDEMTR